MQNYKLKEILENLYLSYKFKFSSKDPVWILHRFENEKDIELMGLITAAYAYGSVEQINRFIDLFLNKIGSKPHEFIINFSKHKDKKYLKDLYYRFYTDGDLERLICSLQSVLADFNSLSNLFLTGYEDSHNNILTALEKFSRAINNNFPKQRANKKKNYLHYMISNPSNGSTSKRMNLFLRWMVRKDEIDLGVWDRISPSKLIIPVDTHIVRVSKKLNLVQRKSIDLKFAVELTGKLKEFDPLDPVKYDFSLCHIGIDKRNILDFGFNKAI